MRSTALIFVLALASVAVWGCKGQPSARSDDTAAASNRSVAMGPARRPPPRRVAARPVVTCPAALPGVQVSVGLTAKRQVRVRVEGKTQALGKRILAAARGIVDASHGLPPDARSRCPVVLTDTRVTVTARPRGADLLLTPRGKLTWQRLHAEARARLRRAFPPPAVSQWKCGAYAGSAPSALQPHQAAHLFKSSPQERLVPTGWDSGDTTISNEARLELLQSAVHHRGGGYVGVGSTQNFLLAAWARAERIWLMDFTRIVVDANRAHIALIQAAPTAKRYQALWRPAQRAAALAELRLRYGKLPDFNKVEQAYLKASKFVTRRLAQLNGWAKKRSYKTWLNDPALYAHIRGLARAGRIRALRGDLNGPRTLCGIGEAAKRLGVKIRILYLSNAEEYKVFRPYKWTFRRNVRNLPADARSLVVRTYTFSPTRLPWPPGWKGVSKVGFHYNAQSLLGFQQLLKLPKLDVKQVMTRASDPDRDGFSLIEK